jgi:hypothetical protein
MRTKIDEPCAVRAASTRPARSEKATKKASPCVSTSTPP